MWHHNVDLLAYHDLDGRSGLKLALQEADGRFFLYVAGFWHPGWSMLDVTDPEHPELLRWLDGPPNTMTIQVQVADGTMITALEHPPPGLTIGDPAAQPQDGFLIWDVHDPGRPSRCLLPAGVRPKPPRRDAWMKWCRSPLTLHDPTPHGAPGPGFDGHLVPRHRIIVAAVITSQHAAPCRRRSSAVPTGACASWQ
jgi:hypothetical protein